MKYVEPILNVKENIHGDYINTATLSQRLKAVIQYHNNDRLNRGQRKLTEVQLESLDQICVKISRIISGDPDEEEHWDDIAGYAKLVSERHREERHNRPFNPFDAAAAETADDLLADRLKEELEQATEMTDAQWASGITGATAPVVDPI